MNDVAEFIRFCISNFYFTVKSKRILYVCCKNTAMICKLFGPFVKNDDTSKV